MKILIVAAESAPYVKVGGLGDVAGSLPRALAALGHEVRLMVPRSETVLPHAGATVDWTGDVRFGDGHVRVAVISEPLPGSPGVEARLVDSPALTGHPLYGGGSEADRFVLLGDAAIADLEHTGWTPDVIHAHDWHASAIVQRVVQARDAGARIGTASTVLTIHNMAYQGTREPGFADWHELPPHPAPGDSADLVNMLGRGLAMADRVTAVSPTFAWEITTPEGAFGLHDVLAGRQEPVAGIVNGIDTDAFNPANDRNIVRRFGIRSLDARSENRLALATHFGLHVDDSTPIVGIVSRLVDQKGLDILAAAVPGLLDRGARLAVIGSGDVGLEQTFWNLAIAHPGAVGVFIGYDARLAQRVYAGCDVFAMPSRFEPCGIGQLIAMRYGAVPLVRRTGGLADTVTPRTGFLFDDPTPAALEAAFDDLLTVFADRDRWPRMQRAGMRLDSSWASSAQEYARIFETLRG